jgi:hypothetical protein
LEVALDKYVNNLKNELHGEISKGAIGYLKTGLDLFHASESATTNMQPAIGNLGIAVELMLKALLVGISPVLLFKDLPIDLRLLFLTPKSMPKGFNWRHFDADIRSYKYKAIELDECISIFYILFPEHKQQIQPYLKLLSQTRNASVHAALPSFHAFDLSRTAYLALRIYLLLEDKKSFGKYTRYVLSKKDTEFLESYEAERESRVRLKVERAKVQSKKAETMHIVVDDWETYVTSCPICGNDALLEGYTDIGAEMDEDGDSEPYLTFFANSFECEACGLNLTDSKELNLAGIEEFYDRSEDLNTWFEDEEEYY